MERLALLRCDAGTSGGIGHLVRCLAVADAARAAGWEVALVGSLDVPLAREMVADAGLPVLADGGTPLDEVARWSGARVVHVDHYATAVPVPSTDGLRPVGPLVSSVQDGRWGRRDADVVLDASASGPVTASVVAARVRLTGPRQALVRAHVRARAGTPQPVRQVLVVAGGTDAAGILGRLTELTVAAAREAATGPYEVLVVDPAARDGGPAWPGVTRRPPGPDLLDVAARSVVVVTAAGTTTSELAVMGVPMAVVQAVANQAETYRELVAGGAALPLGSVSDLGRDTRRLVASLRGLLDDGARRAALADAARSRVDGHGATRLVAAWDAVWEGRADAADRGWWVRRATPGDSDLLLAWRNDAETRMQSIDTAPVLPGDHARWYAAVLRDPDRDLLVVGSGDAHVGTVRFDRLDPGSIEVSLTLAPEVRGQGLAGTVLACGEEHLSSSSGAAVRVVARVREDNHASLALFRRAGYSPADDRTAVPVVAPGLLVLGRDLDPGAASARQA